MNINTIFISLLIITLPLIACKNNLTYEERYVVSQNGLNMRENPNLESKSLTLIPYMEKVKVLEINNHLVTINNIKGKWLKVEWGKQIGWAFDAYLKEKYKGNCSIYYLFNIICYNNDKLCEKLKIYYPNDSKDHFVSLSMLDEIPSLLPNDELIIIKKDKIFEDKIKYLYLKKHKTIGCHLMFNLLSHDLENYSNNCILYIKKSDLFKINKEMPTLNSLSAIKNDELFNYFLSEIFNNFDLYVGQEKENIGINRDFIVKNYNIKLNELITKNFSNKIHIIEFNNKNKSLGNYDFSAIFINKKKVFLNNSEITASYYFNNINYILTTEWIPNSGAYANHLYEFNNNKMILVHRDASLAY